MTPVGILSRFFIPTPRPSLVEAAESIENAMCRLVASTDRLNDLLAEMRAEEENRERRRGA